jgi:hypothetical protein
VVQFWGIAAVRQASTITWVGLRERKTEIIPLSLETVEIDKVTCRGLGGRGGGSGAEADSTNCLHLIVATNG